MAVIIYDPGNNQLFTSWMARSVRPANTQQGLERGHTELMASMTLRYMGPVLVHLNMQQQSSEHVKENQHACIQTP